MKKLLALLKEEKLRENEAIGQVYERKPLSPMDQLPPVLKVLPQMTNPLVRRALSEVRHVVNHLLSERGKPTLVRIELARQLKKSKEEREEEWKKNRSNESNRRTAAKYLLDQRDIRNPSPSLIRKVLLAFECDWHCPYSIEGFNVDDLLSEPPKVQVDHIIPRSRHPEDSFFNQTLCMTWVNQKKGNRTPFEAFGPHVPQDQRGRIRPWNEIEAAVRRFPGASGKIKLERFRMETLESLDDYAARQLNDTAYATKEAKKFLGLLYGGESATRVTAGKGQLTAILRGHWGLKKSRDDHRHHAVDAVVTALQDAAWVKEITDACQRAARLGKDNIDRIPEPWVSFRDDVAASVEKIVVSHRVRRKVQGPLHEETNYRQPKMEAKSKPLAHIRKPLSDLSADQVKLIVDEKVRNLVENKLIELQQKNPKRAFRFAGDHPFFVSRKKRRIPIHRVRIAVSLRTQEIGKDDHLRHVKLGENHHIEIIKGPDEKWEGRLVTRLEAMRRAKEGEVVICKEAKEGGTFVFSLAQGEIIEIDEPGVGRGLWRIRTITRDKDKQGKDKPRILAVRLNDARQKEKIPSTDMRRPFVGGLCVLNCRKVVIDVLGNVRDAND